MTSLFLWEKLMKILHLITGLKIGGAESALFNFLAALPVDLRENHVVAYFHYGSTVEKIKNLGVQTCGLAGKKRTYTFGSLATLNRIIGTFKPNIIHSALWSANIIGRVFSWWSNIPLICDLHGDSFDEGRLRNFFERLTVKLPKAFVAVGDKVADSYRKNIIGAVKSEILQKKISERLVVIKNGIDVQALQNNIQKSTLTRASMGIPKNAFVVGAVGRFEKIKSYDILIKSFAGLLKACGETEKKPFLCLIGDGSQKEFLLNLIKDLGIEQHVLLPGFRDDCYAWYPLFDCFCLSSQSEGISIAMLEAMVAGLPVVTTHDSTKHDVIIDGVNGFLVPVNDCESYVQGLFRLYQDPELCKSMRQKNAALIACNFNIQMVVNGYYQLYQNLIKR